MRINNYSVIRMASHVKQRVGMLKLCTQTGLCTLTPHQNDMVLAHWWHWTGVELRRSTPKRFQSLVILDTWWIWKHRNRSFLWSASMGQCVSQKTSDEARLLCLSGAKELSTLCSGWYCFIKGLVCVSLGVTS